MNLLNEKNPEVSVIIPYFKGSSNHLREALSSVQNQTYKNYEVILIDDGSGENFKSNEIFKSYKFKNKKYISLSKNKGVAHAMNLAIDESKGKYINWLSHDDKLAPTKLEKQVNLLENNENVICYSNFYSFYAYSRFKRVIITKIHKNKKLWLILNDKLHGCSLLIPKKLLKEVGKFDEKLIHTQDYDMWFRLLKKFNFLHLNECLLYSRKHGFQTSLTGEKNANKEKFQLYKKQIKELCHDNNISLFDYLLIIYSFASRLYFRIAYFSYFYLLNNFKKKLSSFFIFALFVPIFFILGAIQGCIFFIFKKIIILLMRKQDP